MSLYLRGEVWWYDFWFKGIRYRDTTHTRIRDDAAWTESELKRQLAFKAAGVEAPGGGPTPRFQDWAEIYCANRQKRVKHPERIETLVRVVLRFFGAKPGPGDKTPAVEGEPYHDLRLGDVIADPYWIERFEQWMDARRAGRPGKTRPLGNQSKKHYLSQLSMMYRVASSAKFRKRTNILQNPFAGMERPPTRGRTVSLDLDQIRALVAHASYHVRLAIAIGALAPELRISNVLALRWKDHLDPLWTRITVEDHKTVLKTGRPLVVPIIEQLRTVLEDAHARGRGSDWVVNYRGRHVKQIRGGVAGAAKRAGLPYGVLTPDGLTFHTIRHSMATLMAELDEPERKRMLAMGHTRLTTTETYTHLRPHFKIPTLTRLSDALPISDLVMQPGMRAVDRSKLTVGTDADGVQNPSDKRADLAIAGGETKRG